MKQKRVRNLPWRNGSTTIAEKKLRSSRRWLEVVDDGRRVWWQWVKWRESAHTRETARERERQRETRNGGGSRVVVALAGGGRRWPKMVNDGRRVWWQWVQRRERESCRGWHGEEEGFAIFKP